MIAFLLQSFSRVIITGDYYLNTSTYAAKCENKAKVAMKCNGKCQMLKKIKQEDENEKKNPERRAENRNDLFINQFSIAVTSNTFSEFTKQHFPIIADPKISDRPHSVFKPPAA